MLEQSYDENELARIYHWWWRDECDYLESVEVLAWRYELARRHDRTNDFPPFPDAEESIWRGLEDIANLTKVYRVNDLPFSQDLEIWDDERNWTGVLNFQWNLSASNKELAANFIRLIEEERRVRRRRVRPKTKGPHGKRNRPISWRWPELLDVAYHVRTPRLADNERSILSQARKAAQNCYRRLQADLSE